MTVLEALAVPLQTLDDWLSGNWFDSLLAPYVDLIGQAGLVLGVGAPFTLALYVQNGDIRPAAVLLALYAGLIIGGAPPLLSTALYLVVVAALAAAGTKVVASR